MTTARHILVPVDFSKCSRAALTYALNRCDGTASEIDVLYVARPVHASITVQSPERAVMSLNDFARNAAMRDLEHLTASLRRPKIRLRAIVEFGDPADVILDVARRNGYEQIVMGAHSHAARADVRLGSVADRVAHSSPPCPVVTVSGEEGQRELAAPTRPARPALTLRPAFEVPGVKWIG
jgi:nucleotide-binding universal stress UspA family protein